MKEKIKILIPKDKIIEKIKELSLDIKKDFKKVIYCVVVLTGAKTFFKDLKNELKKLGLNVNYSFIKLSSYKGTETTGKIKIVVDLKEDINGKDVLIVEDIVDTGLTLNFLKDYLIKRGAKNVKICTLLDKKERRKQPIKLDYVGFTVPDKFIVGYGIDYNEKYRELNFVGYLNENI